MTTFRHRPSRPVSAQAGQAFLVVVFLLGIFLLGALGFVTDYSQLWARRQIAQAAADASCQAGAADLFLYGEGATGHGLDFSWIGTDFACTAHPDSPPCKYAELNGYEPSQVQVSFPATLSGVPDVSSWGHAAPYLQVSVSDQVQLSFTRLLVNNTTANISASAACGMAPVAVPIPLVVLHPTMSGSLSLNGGSGMGTNPVAIIGGPKRSIQVNSSSTTAVTFSGNGTITLANAGPNNNGDFGVFGNQVQPGINNLALGSGAWISPATPYTDPYSQYSPPAVPANAPAPINLDVYLPNPTSAQLAEYCPKYRSAGGTKCVRYQPGYYPTGIAVDGHIVALFDPGIYYLGPPGLSIATNGVVRMSLLDGDGTEGVMFYLSGSATLSVTSNNISACTTIGPPASPNNCVVSFPRDGMIIAGIPDPVRPLKCAAGTLSPLVLANVPEQLDGNILMGHCNGVYGDPAIGGAATGGEYRGFLFFHDRNTAVSASWGGQGQFTLAGAIYFHHTGFGSSLDLSGGSGAGAYAVGNLVADQVSLGGNSTINMILNDVSAYAILRPQLLR